MIKQKFVGPVVLVVKFNFFTNLKQGLYADFLCLSQLHYKIFANYQTRQTLNILHRIS
jgi:hypothetical protein